MKTCEQKLTEAHDTIQQLLKKDVQKDLEIAGLKKAIKELNKQIRRLEAMR